LEVILKKLEVISGNLIDLGITNLPEDICRGVPVKKIFIERLSLDIHTRSGATFPRKLFYPFS
jgi:hypothetical protein